MAQCKLCTRARAGGGDGGSVPIRRNPIRRNPFRRNPFHRNPIRRNANPNPNPNLTLTLNPNFGETGFGETGRHRGGSKESSPM